MHRSQQIKEQLNIAKVNQDIHTSDVETFEYYSAKERLGERDKETPENKVQYLIDPATRNKETNMRRS